MKKYLDEELLEYSKSDMYPFHMPGHKRQSMGEWHPEDIDITEIDGFDNLHHPEGIIRHSQNRLAKLFGADESFFLVNGSTGGILAAICGTVHKGDRVLIGRNCHKAVYHAAYLMELKLEYVYPQPTEFGIQGSICPEAVREKLDQYSDVAAVVVTSPTYDGIVSDIEGIAAVVHERKIPLIVDEAHGAHFGFTEEFPKKAIDFGADLCIESLHKTLPSYTQTAVLHMKKTAGTGERSYLFDRNRVERYLGIFQTSSPSYVFMAGMDRCVRMMEQDLELYAQKDQKMASLFGTYERHLREFYEGCGQLKNIEVYPYRSCEEKDHIRQKEEKNSGVWGKDNSKVLISAHKAGVSGQQLYDILLDQYHLQMEMASGHYVTALTSLMDTQEGFERLKNALEELDERLDKGSQSPKWRLTPLELYSPREKKLELAQAMDSSREAVLLESASGQVSGEFIYLYPPGIPIITPGEILTQPVIEQIRICRKQGLQVQGLQDYRGEYVLVCGE